MQDEHSSQSSHTTSGAKPAAAQQQVMSGADEYLRIHQQISHWGVTMRWDVAQSKTEVARWN